MSDKPFPPPYTTLGAIEIGMAFSTLLFGVVSLQTFNYYRNFPNDSWRLKALVGAVWVLELAHSICSWHGMFLVTVTFYGQPSHILDPPVTIVLISLFAGIIVVLVQGFFCFRIYRLSGRKLWLPIFCFVLAVSPLMFSLKILAIFIESGEFSSLLQGTGKILLTTATALVPVEHGAVAGVLIYYLLKMKRSNSFPQTRSMVDSIVLWTIETTLAATLMSVIELIMFLTRNDLVFFSFYVVHGKRESFTQPARPRSSHPALQWFRTRCSHHSMVAIGSATAATCKLAATKHTG
ncbi:hypothetical protein GGX14DRAFT_471281, partial [Mycena pura]